MNIYVLSQEDAFYIPRLLDHVFSKRRDVVGIGIVAGEMRQRNFRKYLALMGVRDFAVQAANVAAHAALRRLGRILPLGRSFSVADAARRHKVPCERVPDVNAPAFVESLRARGVELIVSVACPQVLKRPILDVPRAGAINIHGALLPDYQGLLPSFWVLANGESETGVTVHYISERLDGGDIIRQQRIAIRPDDTMHSLVRRSKIDVGKHLLVEAIEAIDAGVVERRAMDLTRARYFSFPDAAAVREFRRRGRRFV